MRNRTLRRLLVAAAALSCLGVAVGSAQERADKREIVPFQVLIPDAQLEDLKSRLEAARWPVMPTTRWSHGQPVHFIKELVEEWINDFDWRAREAELNRYPQFLTEIDGQQIHFLHIRSPEPNAFPLLLTHGWPSSVAEFVKVIGPLADPAFHNLDPDIAFDLVIPSLPGFGFSGPVKEPGWDSIRTARAWDTLMKRLGYSRYGAHGTDVGAWVTRELGILAPDGLVGVHLQQIFAFPSGADGEMEKLTPFELEGIAFFQEFLDAAGYHLIQAKRPGTLSYGLVDSPVGLLAWNSELFFGHDGQGYSSTDRDDFLTHVSISWFTGTGGSSTNIYLENAITGGGLREEANRTPTGVAVFPRDFRTVRTFAERSNNIVHWSTEMPRGGHFASVDAPDLVVADIRKFFRSLR